MNFFSFSREKDWKKQLQAVGKALGELPPSFEGMEGLRTAIKTVTTRLDRDLEELRRDGAFIFATEEKDHTDENVALLRRWHTQGQSPSLLALCIFTMENLPLNLAPDITQGLLAAALLGEIENGLPYHNNMHYRKVMLQLMRLIKAHNRIYKDTARAFDDGQIALLLIAACVHDLGHDGKGNTLKGIHHPGHIEKRSFAAAEDYLRLFGLEETEMSDLKVLLLATDVSPLADPGNYMNQMKAAYRYHFLGERKGLQSLNLDGDLAPLQKNAKLAMMCLILHEADISTSAGLDYNTTKYETAIYGREIGEEAPRPSHIIEFLDTVCQKRMISDAAQELYAANMARIYALAEKEVQDGNHTFQESELLQFTASSSENPKTIN